MLNLSINEYPVIFWGKLLHKKVGWLILTGILINSSAGCQETAMSEIKHVLEKGCYTREDREFPYRSLHSRIFKAC